VIIMLLYLSTSILCEHKTMVFSSKVNKFDYFELCKLLSNIPFQFLKVVIQNNI